MGKLCPARLARARRANVVSLCVIQLFVVWQLNPVLLIYQRPLRSHPLLSSPSWTTLGSLRSSAPWGLSCRGPFRADISWLSGAKMTLPGCTWSTSCPPGQKRFAVGGSGGKLGGAETQGSTYCGRRRRVEELPLGSLAPHQFFPSILGEGSRKEDTTTHD